MEPTTWLSKELYKRGWSQSELARRAGISQQTISAIINARNKPSTQTSKAIAKALNLPLQIVLENLGVIETKTRSKENEITIRLSLLSKEELQAILTIIKSLTRKK